MSAAETARDELRRIFPAHPGATITTKPLRGCLPFPWTRFYWQDVPLGAEDGERGPLADVPESDIVPVTLALLSELENLRHAKAKAKGAGA